MASNNQKIILSFLAGAAAGVAVGMYLSSDQGQETVRQVKGRLNELEGEFGEKLQQQVGELSGQIDEMMERMQGEVAAQAEELSRQSQTLLDQGKEKIAEVKEKASRKIAAPENGDA